MQNRKLIRITTVPISLQFLLPGQMKFMSENAFEVLMISADGKERETVMQNENCKHEIVAFTRKITPLTDLKCLWQLIKIFKKEKPDIVHTHTPKAGLLGMMAAKICGVKLRIHTVAGMPLMVNTGAKLHLLKFIEKLTYASANYVWPNSFSLLDYIKKNNFTSTKKLNIINQGSSNGIDLKRFSKNNLDSKIIEEIKNTIGYNEKNIYLLSIGRLVKDKGIVELVNVFKKLQKNNSHLKLLLLGTFENDLDPLPLNIVEEIKNNKNIIHVEWTKQVQYYFSIANLFIFASHREGFPNVLLQSGAMGLPIVCSAITGNIDIVENNKTGLLFDVGNENQIEEKIMFALAHKNKMQQMAVDLQNNIETNFDRKKIWSSILDEYKKLLSLHGAA